MLRRATLLLFLLLALDFIAPPPARGDAGYRPTTGQSCHRPFPGGPQQWRAASWAAASPWAIACAGVNDPETCLRNDGFLDFTKPGVAAAYQARYGFSWTDNLGGWCGRSSEAASRVGEALNWFCANRPERIGSAGRPANDCQASAVEVTDALASMDSTRLAAEFCQATEGNPDCAPKVPDPPHPPACPTAELCASCFPPPPPIPCPDLFCPSCAAACPLPARYLADVEAVSKFCAKNRCSARLKRILAVGQKQIEACKAAKREPALPGLLGFDVQPNHLKD